MNNIFEGIVGTAVTKIFDLEVARTGLSPVEADREGYRYFVSTIEGRSRSSAYPAGKPIIITYIVEYGAGKLLGAQMAGVEGVAHRIDTLATCLYNKNDRSRCGEIGPRIRASPFATVWDPILIAANAALKKLKKNRVRRYKMDRDIFATRVFKEEQDAPQCHIIYPGTDNDASEIDLGDRP